MTHSNNRPTATALQVRIENDQLVISIGVTSLLFALQIMDDWPEDLFVSDEAGFLNDLVNTLSAEAEDGSTPVHRLLDRAGIETLDQGSAHIDDGSSEQAVHRLGVRLGIPIYLADGEAST